MKPSVSLTLCLCAWSVFLSAQGLDPDVILNPPKDTWPTYNGDYSGRRFSQLEQINKSNISLLTQAWSFQTDIPTEQIKSTPLLVNGILYFTEPDEIWAVDARTGQQLWHYHYGPSEGLHIGQRGVGMYRGWLYFETSDAHLLCLDARDGKVRWKVELADVKLGYWATMSPVIIRNHVIVGISGDFTDLHGFVESFDPENGKVQWKWSALPAPGAPGSETWPKNSDAIQHGGGMTWMPGTYDPGLNLLYWGTGNPNPVMDGQTRPGDNLFTCSIVALDPDTGELKWYFQTSPHDTHDYDATQTPIIADADFGGTRRKLLLQASRDGYFFVLDRATGKSLLSVPFESINWSSGVDREGRPIGLVEKYPSPAGVLVEPDARGSTNWRSPSFDPDTGLFYVSAVRSFSMYYHTSTGKPEGYAGKDFYLWAHSSLRALDYQTGKTRWEYDLGPGTGSAGVIATAGGIVFTADVNGNLLALDASTGGLLWHAYAGSTVGNSPMTYELDGRQYFVIGAHGVLSAWALPEAVVKSLSSSGRTAVSRPAIEQH
ncbi:MAG TPA: acido-empty-quinoprotein group A [Bryobacteraceae bacterium]|jgi:alcohol dehydrogenase (cytochrome c)|nr:acido-empty-quinoprotein group A [Bryobacteraceae bacterium]